MAEPVELITISGEDITVDLVLWRRFGRAGQAMVERTLVLNPGVAEAGAVLPVGTRLLLPLPPAPSAVVAEPVSLFE